MCTDVLPGNTKALIINCWRSGGYTTDLSLSRSPSLTLTHPHLLHPPTTTATHHKPCVLKMCKRYPTPATQQGHENASEEQGSASAIRTHVSLSQPQWSVDSLGMQSPTYMSIVSHYTYNLRVYNLPFWGKLYDCYLAVYYSFIDIFVCIFSLFFILPFTLSLIPHKKLAGRHDFVEKTCWLIISQSCCYSTFPLTSYCTPRRLGCDLHTITSSPRLFCLQSATAFIFSFLFRYNKNGNYKNPQLCAPFALPTFLPVLKQQLCRLYRHK